MVKKILYRDEYRTARRVRSDKDCRDTTEQTTGYHETKNKSSQLLVRRQINHQDEQNLYRTKVERQVAFWQYTTKHRTRRFVVKFIFIGIYVVENFYRLRNNPHVQQNLCALFDGQLLRKDKQPHHQCKGNGNQNQMSCPKKRSISHILSSVKKNLYRH